MVTDTLFVLDSLWRPRFGEIRHDTATGSIQLSPCSKDCSTILETSFQVDRADMSEALYTHAGSFTIPLERLGIDSATGSQVARFFNGRHPVVARRVSRDSLVLVLNAGHPEGHDYIALVGRYADGAFVGVWMSHLYLPPLSGHFMLRRSIGP
jgi:hypothetical protein